MTQPTSAPPQETRRETYGESLARHNPVKYLLSGMIGTFFAGQMYAEFALKENQVADPIVAEQSIAAHISRIADLSLQKTQLELIDQRETEKLRVARTKFRDAYLTTEIKILVDEVIGEGRADDLMVDVKSYRDSVFFDDDIAQTNLSKIIVKTGTNGEYALKECRSAAKTKLGSAYGENLQSAFEITQCTGHTSLGFVGLSFLAMPVSLALSFAIPAFARRRVAVTVPEAAPQKPKLKLEV